MSSRACDPSAVDDAEFDLHPSAYSAAGAMRAGFELYRAFDRDSEDNRVTLKRTGELAIPVFPGMTFHGMTFRLPTIISKAVIAA